MPLLVDERATATDFPVIAYDDPIFRGSLTADDAAADFPADAARSYGTYEGWRPGTSSSNLTATLPAAQSVDFIAAVCIGAGSGLTVLAQHSTDGSNYTDVGSAQNADNGVLLWLFDAVASVTNVRLVVTNGNAAGFRIANFMAGERLDMQRALYVGHTPITFGRNSIITSNRAESGQFLGRIQRRETLRTSVAIANLTAAFYRSDVDPAFQALQLRPAYWAWRPTRTEEVAYAWVQGDPQVSNQRPNGMMSINFELASGEFR
jgi:hypothetical protein